MSHREHRDRYLSRDRSPKESSSRRDSKHREKVRKQARNDENLLNFNCFDILEERKIGKEELTQGQRTIG